MIPRYSRSEMAAIWAPESRFRIWLEIEAHACDAQAELGVIPREAAQALWDRGNFEVARIDEIERETKHDVIAFLTNLAEHVGPEARFVHQGMTSSDVLDTCFAVQLSRAADILLADIDAVLSALKRRAFEHKLTPCVGRSHGVHAEPTTFGLKLAGFYVEWRRNRDRLVMARREIATCAISGAVGAFATIDPAVERHVADKMGLAVEPVSTQVIPRDRHAMFFATLGVIASSVERLAIEIRHLQRTEVREAEEYFSEGQKGSSAMPHKRNPVLAENLTGLARMVRAAVIPALEDVALWHERDISHSSVERFIGPDATITLDFALVRLTELIDRLVVYPERMRANLDSLQGLVFSQRVLLALTQAGMSRERAYEVVQRHAMAVWEGGGRFLDLLAADPEVSRYLDRASLAALFDLACHLRYVEEIFRRVFAQNGDPALTRSLRSPPSPTGRGPGDAAPSSPSPTGRGSG
jgi:adenylosuccinate lyase